MIMGTTMDMDNMMRHQNITLAMIIITKEMLMPTILDMDMDTMVFMGKKIIYKICTGQISSLVTIIHVPIIIADFMDTGSSKQDMCMEDIPTIDTTTDATTIFVE